MSLPSQPQAYGAGMAGASFDPVSFVKRPQVILRIVSWVGNLSTSFVNLYFLHKTQNVYTSRSTFDNG